MVTGSCRSKRTVVYNCQLLFYAMIAGKLLTGQTTFSAINLPMKNPHYIMTPWLPTATPSKYYASLEEEEGYFDIILLSTEK